MKNEFYTQFRIKPERVDRAYELYLQGESIRSMARQISVSTNTIQRWVKVFEEMQL